MHNKGFEIVDHTADIGIKVWAKQLSDLFTEAARGMMFIIMDREIIQAKKRKKIKVEAESREELFLKWLKEILYVIEKDGVVFSEFQIENDNLSYCYDFKYFIQAKLKGEKLNPTRHGICTEIKAVTRHNFFLKREENIWKTFVLFDI